MSNLYSSPSSWYILFCDVTRIAPVMASGAFYRTRSSLLQNESLFLKQPTTDQPTTLHLPTVPPTGCHKITFN